MLSSPRRINKEMDQLNERIATLRNALSEDYLSIT